MLCTFVSSNEQITSILNFMVLDGGTNELPSSDVLVPTISSDIQSLSLSTKADGFVSSIMVGICNT